MKLSQKQSFCYLVSLCHSRADGNPEFSKASGYPMLNAPTFGFAGMTKHRTLWTDTIIVISEQQSVISRQ